MAKKKRDPAFEKWFAENRESEDLRCTYANCCMDIEYGGEKPPTFKQWCREYYVKAECEDFS